MPRKIAIVLAALIVPGGLIALCGAAVYKALQQSQRGRRVLALARRSVPAWPSSPRGDGQRQAA